MQNETLMAEAEARISAHRTGYVEISVLDAAGAPVPAARLVATLDRHEFRIGANGFTLRGGSQQAVGAADASSTTAYERQFEALMNYATLPFYWGSYEAESGREQADRLRMMAGWCRERGMRVKGHPLAWHAVFPRWAEALDDEVVLRRQRERIVRIVKACRGLIGSWDVFNEITVAADFDNAIGRWVRDRGALACAAEALALAREADPDAELLYNDFNISPAFEALVEALQAHGAAFDAIGIQSHMHKGAWSLSRVWDVCNAYARFGMPLHFTELTILSGPLKAEGDNDWHSRRSDWHSTPDGEQRQLEEGRDIYTLLFSHPAVDAITWWDFSDQSSWQGAPAGLLRPDMTPKPLADWLRDAFRERWTTRAEIRTDASGRARFRGFFGDYTIAGVGPNGQRIVGACSFLRRGSRFATLRLDESPLSQADG